MKTIFLIWSELFICVALHEFSHVIVILSLKTPIKKIQIGYFPIIRINKLIIGALPLGGKVSFKINKNISPLLLSLIFVIGPLMTMLLLIISFKFDIYQQKIIQVVLISQMILTIFGEGSDIKNIIKILRRY